MAGKAKAKERAKGSLEKAKVIVTARARKEKPRSLGRTFDDTCHFCKQPGRYKVQCRKYAALSSNTRYKRIRARLPNEKVYVYDILED